VRLDQPGYPQATETTLQRGVVEAGDQLAELGEGEGPSGEGADDHRIPSRNQ
jgi:hypothetical protein